MRHNKNFHTSTSYREKTKQQPFFISSSLTLHQFQNGLWHETHQSYHPVEKRALDKEIGHEWGRHLDGLPRKYLTLFNGTLEQKQAKSHLDKLKWLTTIWTLRETVSSTYFTQLQHEIDPMTRHRYMSWKEAL